METPHNAPPRIALALPTEQQVLGERERERAGAPESRLLSSLTPKCSAECICAQKSRYKSTHPSLSHSTPEMPRLPQSLYMQDLLRNSVPHPFSQP